MIVMNEVGKDHVERSTVPCVSRPSGPLHLAAPTPAIWGCPDAAQSGDAGGFTDEPGIDLGSIMKGQRCKASPRKCRC